MTRIPQIAPENMNAEQKRVYDDVMATTGRSGGPSIGYAYAPGLWETTNAVSDYLGKSSLSPKELRIAAVTTARHWNADFPFAVQVRMALASGIEPAVIDAINEGNRPDLSDAGEDAVYTVARELLSTGTLTDATFAKARDTLGLERLVDTVGAVGHFCKVCMMANTVGAVAPDDVPVRLKA